MDTNTSPAAPSTSIPTTPPQKKNYSWLIAVMAIFVLIPFCCIVSWRLSTLVGNSPIANSPTSGTSTPSTSYNPPIFNQTSNSSVIVEDIFNTNLQFTRDEQVTVSEMDLLRFALETAVAKNWSGNRNDKLPIAKSDITSELITNYEKDNQRLESYFAIPTNLRPLFIEGNASQEITQIIYSARKEYLKYLAAKGVSQKYINEIDTNTLPESSSRIFYHPSDDYDSPPSAVEGLKDSSGSKNDYSQLQMDIYAGDVHNHTRSIVQSGLLGPVPKDTNSSEYVAYYKHAREIGIRYLIYHEMSHVLQRAYDVQNTPVANRKDKSSWISASRSMWKISDKYFVKWDSLESFTDVENHNLSQESQAEGISFEMLCSVYHLSPVQKQLLWEYLFGRLDTARGNYEAVIKIFHDRYPNYPILEMPNQIYNDIVRLYPAGEREATALYQVQKRMSNLSGYGGYFHPMLPEDMPLLWSYIQQ